MLVNRGAGGYWRTYQAQQLATPESFQANPSLVWEFYSYRREVMHSKVPHTHSHTLSCKSVLPVRRPHISRLALFPGSSPHGPQNTPRVVSKPFMNFS